MKKTLLLALLIITCVTCGDKATIEPIELNTDKLTFSEDAASQYISLTTTAEWTASAEYRTASDAPWLECVPNSGKGNGRVQIKVTQNDSENARAASVIFRTAGGSTATLEVLQEVAAPFIIIQPTAFEALVVGQEVSISVTANYAWEISIPADALGWVSQQSKTGNDAVLQVMANDTDSNRETAIVFRLEGKEVSTVLALSQKSADNAGAISLSPESADVPAAGGDVPVTVSAGIEWNIAIPAGDTWITIKEKTANRAVFAVTENMTGAVRSSNIVFASGDGKASATFALTQNKDYTLTSALVFPETLEGKPYSNIHSFAQGYGFDYSENPHCSGGYGGHADGTHLVVEKDATLNMEALRFDIHIDPVIDGDRCNATTVDRQRNEFKSATNNSTWAKVQGNYDEWQVLEWKFKLPAGFQPTTSFCHIHQIKAQDGSNNSSPVITITPRANSNGSSKRMQIIHSVDGGTGTALGTFVDNIPLADFEGEWVQVRQEIHYTHSGYYACKITRIRDGKVLIDVEKNNIDMWRKGSSYIRSKYGIYRSLAGGDLSKNPVGQSALLKNESIWMCDFKVYEKNSNPSPGTAHD